MNLKLSRMPSALRRVLALDVGGRRLKLLLAESDFGRVRVLGEEMLDVQAEGLVSAEETGAWLRQRMDHWGNPPVALVLPQHISISQVIDLPMAPEAEVEKLIAGEAIKLSGVSSSRIIYDFVRTEAPANDRQRFWVTLSQEGDIRERITKAGLEPGDLCEVTTGANALIAAFRATSPLASRSILVNVGAETTVIVILLAGQGAFAANFQMGGDFFTRALARLRNCSDEEAERLKREQNLLEGSQSLPEFKEIIDGWVNELKRQLHDWFEHNPSLMAELGTFEWIACGGAFEQPGLLGYLKSSARLDFKTWPHAAQPGNTTPGRHFEMAFGAALQALGSAAQPVSLLPEDFRLAWSRRRKQQKFEVANMVLISVCILLLSLGTWWRVSMIRHKAALREKVQAAIESVRANAAFSSELNSEYDTFRPVFAAQQNTKDMLQTFALLQQFHTSDNSWYVTIADEQSYFSYPVVAAATNRPPKTNSLVPLPPEPVAGSIPTPPPVAAAPPPVKPGLMAEICLADDPDTARAKLGQLVKDLKKQPLFSKSDLLPDDLRRKIADPKVLMPGRDFVLELDFAASEFQPPPGKKGGDTLGSHGSIRRWPRPKSATDAGQISP